MDVAAKGDLFGHGALGWMAPRMDNLWTIVNRGVRGRKESRQSRFLLAFP
jgi:hypothetical protein